MTPEQKQIYVDGRYVAQNHVGPRLRLRQLTALATPRSHDLRSPDQPFFPYGQRRSARARDGKEMAQMISDEMATQIQATRLIYNRPLTDGEQCNFSLGNPLGSAITRVDPGPYMGWTGRKERYRPFCISPGGVDLLSTMTPPYVAAVMLRLLDLRPDSDVLVVGTGTGYTTHLIQECLGPGGRVCSLDVDWRVAGRARQELEKHRQPSDGKTIRFLTGDWGRIELRACFDRIVFFAALPYLPAKAVRQLEFLQDGVVVYPQYAPYPDGEAFPEQIARLMVYRVSIENGGTLEETLCKTDFYHPFVHLRPLGREEEWLQQAKET